jgi:hypothetical protein
MVSKLVYLAIASVMLLIITIILLLPQMTANPNQPLVDECIAACQKYLATGKTLDVGPCLLNPINGTEWVCDVAHSPRMQLDNMPDNQCSAYNGGSASHFIEIMPNCTFIRMA